MNGLINLRYNDQQIVLASSVSWIIITLWFFLAGVTRVLTTYICTSVNHQDLDNFSFHYYFAFNFHAHRLKSIAIINVNSRKLSLVFVCINNSLTSIRLWYYRPLSFKITTGTLCNYYYVFSFHDYNIYCVFY